MDPLAMAGTALSILNKMKEQIKDCEAAFVEARDLNKQIQGFEVTIMMIPTRAASEEESGPETKERTSVEIPVVQSGIKGVASKVGDYGVELKNFAKEKVQDAAMDMISSSPLGVAIELFTIGKDLEPIFDDGISPGAKLQEMKSLKDANNIRIYSDLEVMFQGMAFIVKNALQCIQEAIEVLKQMNDMGIPNCCWTIMPWKVQQTLALKEELAGHREALARQVVALQTAIGVASYAVQLEQLESVLDATSVFKHRDMKLLWKKKIGCDKTKVAVSEFCEAFFSEVCKELDSKREKYRLKEKIDRKLCPDIALTRFLNDLFNDNGDESLSVYELSSALTQMEKDGLFLRPLDSIGFTISSILRKELRFLSSIKFSYIDYDVGADGVAGTNDDSAKILRDGVPIIVRPFHRALIIAEVPMLSEDFYDYDHLALLLFEKPRNPIEHVTKTYSMSVVRKTRCYVKRDINKVVQTRNDCNWNGFRSFKGSSKPPGFQESYNWEVVKVAGKGDKSDGKKVEDEKHDDEDEESREFNRRVKILYCPVLETPGMYSPRYCLDSYEEKNDGISTSKKMAISSKSYYRGNYDPIANGGMTVKERRTSIAQLNKDKKEATSKQERKKSVKGDGAAVAIAEAEVIKENLALIGPVIHCPDITEMVWGEKVTEDYGMDDSDDEETKEKWRPYLNTEYPYLPIRKLHEFEPPEKLSVYVNLLRKKKSKKDGSDKKGEAVEGAKEPLDEQDQYDPTHIGLFVMDGKIIHELKINHEDPVHTFKFQEVLQSAGIEPLDENDELAAQHKGDDEKSPILDSSLYPHVSLTLGYDPDHPRDEDSYYDSDMYSFDSSDEDDSDEDDSDEDEEETAEGEEEGDKEEEHSNVDSNTNDNIRLSDIDPEMPPLASVGSNPMTSFSNPMHDIKGSDVEEGSDAEDHDDEDD